MVDFGGIIGAAAGWLGNQNTKEAQSRSNQQYQGAFGEYTNESQAAQQAMQQYLAAQQGAGYQGYDQLASALGSPQRQQAGEAYRSDLNGRLGQAMGSGAGGQAPNSRSWAGGGSGGQQWGNMAYAQRYQPRLAASGAALGQGAAQAGMQDYDTAAYQQQQQGALNIGRQTQEQQQQAQLMQQFRNNQLQTAASTYGYTGPSQGTYNLQLYGALAGAGANAASGYLAGNSAPTRDYGSPSAPGGQATW